jgi:hypothetical protein
MSAAYATQHKSVHKSDTEEPTSEDEEPSFKGKCATILNMTGLLAEETSVQLAPKGTDEWCKHEIARIFFDEPPPSPKYTDPKLVARAVVSFFKQHLLLDGKRKDYCALMCTLLLVIFPSSNPDDMEISARLLAYLTKDERFEPYVRFVKGSILDPTVKERVQEITSFWNDTLGTGIFRDCAQGFNYNNMHRTAEQIADMRDDNHIPELFLGFFLQWLPYRQNGLNFCASRWHQNAKESFGYAATLLYSAMP